MADEIEYRVAYDYVAYEDEYIGDDDDGSSMYETVELDASDYYYVFAEDEEDARAKALSDLRYRDEVTIWDIEPVD